MIQPVQDCNEMANGAFWFGAAVGLIVGIGLTWVVALYKKFDRKLEQ